MGAKIFFSYGIVIICMVVLAGCAASGVSPADMQKRQQALSVSDHLIVPGDRIGPVRLGMGMDEVIAMLGQPDVIFELDDGTMDHRVYPQWRYWSMNLVVDFDMSTAPAVTAVSTQNWTDKPLTIIYRTAGGVGLGSSFFDAKRDQSGSPTVDTVCNDGHKMLDYPNIEFLSHSNTSGTISIITVFPER